MGLTNLVRGAANSISHGSPAKPQPQSGSTTTTTASSTASSTPAPAAAGSAGSASAGEDKLMDGAIADDTEVLDDEPKNSQSASSFPCPRVSGAVASPLHSSRGMLSPSGFPFSIQETGVSHLARWQLAFESRDSGITPEVGDR